MVVDVVVEVSDGVRLFELSDAAGSRPLAAAASELEVLVATGRTALTDRERRVFTEFVLGGVAEELRRRLDQADALVAAMNDSLATIRTTAFVPVDLNSLLHHLEATIAHACREDAQPQCAREFEERAARRRIAIEAHLWSEAGFYADYDFERGVTRAHLTAATLMGLASTRAEEHPALLRLAAGGFRDMTRIASGRPDIWLDICAENREAIVATLDGLIRGLSDVRAVVADDDPDRLLDRLTAARDARTNLPGSVAHPEQMSEFRIPIPDRPGAAAEVFTLAAELGVNIDSFEVVHNAEGTGGVAVVLVDVGDADLFRGGLLARGYRPAVTRLS